MDNNPSLMQYMANPKAFTLKKWFGELLKSNSKNHEDIIERLSLALITNKDLEDFGKLIANVYESGYFKAIADYKKQLGKMGLKVEIVPEEQKDENIDW